MTLVAVSQRVRHLEDELGPLLIRRLRHIELADKCLKLRLSDADAHSGQISLNLSDGKDVIVENNDSHIGSNGVLRLVQNIPESDSILTVLIWNDHPWRYQVSRRRRASYDLR
ncbi:helix-turn-helix domain-containing protein [Pseudomonas aeruginosa]|uniref:helix-turn-helix domain-containing protein n=1 Tax=Pseudomonas aeruginosa TaxID=287 RepID=UPI003CEA46F7